MKKEMHKIGDYIGNSFILSKELINEIDNV